MGSCVLSFRDKRKNRRKTVTVHSGKKPVIAGAFVPWPQDRDGPCSQSREGSPFLAGCASRTPAGLLLPLLLLGFSGPEPGQPPLVITATGEMALARAGSFVMGSDHGEADERPTRRVSLDAFLIDTCEVTQDQFEQLMHKSPAHFKGPNHPVEQVSWADGALYCNARSRAEGLEPCYDEETGACDFDADGYRLPTEAEWEYACRAGAPAEFACGSDPGKLRDYAWFADNAGKSTHPAGAKKPNAWGIHDMHGNVLEWCNDVYEEEYYAGAPGQNPRGPEDEPGAKFVLRGGAWDSSADACRAAYRAGDDPGQIDGCFRRDQIGFRCVRKPPATMLESAGAGIRN